MNLKSIVQGYNAIKRRAFYHYKRGNYEQTLSLIDKAAVIASQIMWQYSDSELEDLLSDVSHKILGSKEGNYLADEKRIVIYDSFGLTYILSVQYLKALINQGYQILYLLEEKDHTHGRLVPMIDVVLQYPDVELKFIKASSSKIERIKNIYDSIIDYKPSKLFLHIDTFGVIIPALYSLPDCLEKYYINLGDHAFWLGVKAVDYSLEFRSFGATVTNEKRGLNLEKILLLPYYPIINNSVFQGFPDIVKNKVVIFSGGDFYKTVDIENTYWNLVKEILIRYDEVVFLFASKLAYSHAQDLMNSFVSENGFEDRFINIGFRSDINEVFKNCDIFMGTCPMSGGLMSQYAAINSKPILQFYPPHLSSNNETESMVCYNSQMPISFTNQAEFFNEVDRLVNDKLYRENVGRRLFGCMITEQQFNNNLRFALVNKRTPVDIEKVDVNYSALTNWWLEIGEKGYYDVQAFIYSVLGVSGVWTAPVVTGSYLFKRYIKTKLLSMSWYKRKLKL